MFQGHGWRIRMGRYCMFEGAVDLWVAEGDGTGGRNSQLGNGKGKLMEGFEVMGKMLILDLEVVGKLLKGFKEWQDVMCDR